MKALCLCILSLILFTQCDPFHQFQEEDKYYTVIRVELNNDSRVIPLGEMIVATVQFPDTLKIFDTKTNTYIEEYLHSIQYANFGMSIARIDTLKHKTYPPYRDSSEIDIFVLEGTMTNNTEKYTGVGAEFTKQKPFRVQLGFKPRQKGVYYLSMVSQPRKISYNNKKLRLPVLYRFDVPNQNLDLIAKYQYPNNSDWFYSSYWQTFSMGGGMYAFKVE